MSKFKFINLLDIVFISLIIFFICFAWIQFFVKNFILSLFLSCLLSIGIILGLHLLKNNKNSRINNSITKSNNLAKFKIALLTLPSTKVTQLIKKLLPKNISFMTKKGDIIFTKDNKVNLYTFYYYNELDDNRLLEIIKTKKADKLTIFCASFTASAKILTTSFTNITINLITFDQLYQLCVDNNITLNTDHIDLTTHKVTIKDILKGFVTKSKSKKYFMSGLIILFTSLIVPHKIYYVVFSTILFTLSLVCKFKHTPNAPNLLE